MPMMKRLLLTSILLLTIMVSASTALAEPPIHECDRLAANPSDPHKVVTGVKFDELDASRAISSCKKAVQLFPDVARFQYQYGRALYKGEQYRNAIKWSRKAAEQGYAAAQFNLALMYDEGEGVPKDDVQAYMWFNLAAAQEYEDAAEHRDKLAEKMTPGQVAEAQRLASRWTEKHRK